MSAATGLILGALLAGAVVAITSITAARFNYWRTWCPRLTPLVLGLDVVALAVVGVAASVGTRAGGWEPSGLTFFDSLIPAVAANLAVRRRHSEKANSGDDLLLSLTRFGHDYLDDEVKVTVREIVWKADPATIDRWWQERRDEILEFQPSADTTNAQLSLEDRRRILVAFILKTGERRLR